MATPRRTTSKPTNGHLGYRDARELIDDAKREILETVSRVDARLTSLDEHGTRGLGLMQERVRVNETAIKEVRESVESLNLSRAEARGRTAVIAIIVSAFISLLVGFVLFLFTRAAESPEHHMQPQPTPTIVVTVVPAFATPAPIPPVQVVDGAVVVRVPHEHHDHPSSPTPSPTPSPSRGPDVIDVFCNTLPPKLPPQACAARKRIPLKILVGLPPALGLGLVLVTRRRGDACSIGR